MSEFLQYLAAGLMTGCIYGLIAVGFTAVYNVTGIVNFAQGDASMLGALAAIGILGFGVPLPIAVILSICIVAAVFVFVERIAIRPAGANPIRGIIITIGVGITLQGIAAIIWGTGAHPLPAFSGESFLSFGEVTVPLQSLWIAGITALLMFFLYMFFSKTYVGKAFRACAMDPVAAGLMGIPANAMRGMGFLISGAVGAVAGIIVAPIAFMQFDSGIPLGIKGFVASVIGGFGNPIGAVIGGLLLGIVEAFSTGYLSSGFKNAIAFLVLLVFLLVRPGGLLGEFDTVKR